MPGSLGVTDKLLYAVMPVISTTTTNQVFKGPAPLIVLPPAELRRCVLDHVPNFSGTLKQCTVLGRGGARLLTGTYSWGTHASR